MILIWLNHFTEYSKTVKPMYRYLFMFKIRYYYHRNASIKKRYSTSLFCIIFVFFNNFIHFYLRFVWISNCCIWHPVRVATFADLYNFRRNVIPHNV
jgi:hypothetical protein